MDGSGSKQALLDLELVCRRIMKGYRFVYSVLLEWYPRRLYTELQKGLLEIASADSSSRLSSACPTYFTRHRTLNNLCLLLANRVIVRSILVLIFMLVVYAIYAYSGKAKFFLESFRNKVFRFIAFYIFTVLPFQNTFPLIHLQDLPILRLKATNFIIIEIINILLCILICYCLNYAIRMLNKAYERSHLIADSSTNSYICTLFETDPETGIEFKLVVRDEEYFETLVERIAPRIVVSLFYLYNMNTMLLLAAGNSTLELTMLLFLIVIGYFLTRGISGNNYGNGIIYNYINTYFISFLAFLVQTACVIVYMLFLLNFLCPRSDFKNFWFSLFDSAIAYLFFQNNDASSAFANLIIVFIFIVYCICDTNRDETLDSREEIKKSYRIFENLKKYLYYAKTIRTTPLHLLFPLNITEICCEKEYRKLVHAHFKAINKFHDLKDLLKSRARITLSAYNSSQSSTTLFLGSDTASPIENLQKAKAQKNLLIKLYKVSFNLSMNYFRLFKKDALNNTEYMDE